MIFDAWQCNYKESDMCDILSSLILMWSGMSCTAPGRYHPPRKPSAHELRRADNPSCTWYYTDEKGRTHCAKSHKFWRVYNPE